MADPILTRTYSTRRNIPLLDTTDYPKYTKSWALALFRSMIDIEVTGTLSGTRHANSTWAYLRSSDGTTVVTSPTAHNWTGLSALIGNTTGTAHSWVVLEKGGYQCCIDLNTTLTSGFFRIAFTKSTSPFTTGTPTSAPISSNEWTVGVASGGQAAGFTFVSSPTGGFGQVHYFHYSAAQDNEFFCLSNRVGAFCFDIFYCFQSTENVAANDLSNYFTCASQTAGSPNSRGTPPMGISSNPGTTGRFYNDSAVISTGGIQNPNFGGTVWPGANLKDYARNQYPAFRLDMGNTSGSPALRGNFRDWYAIGIEISRIGQVFPTAGSPTHVVAGDFLIPFVGGSPQM